MTLHEELTRGVTEELSTDFKDLADVIGRSRWRMEVHLTAHLPVEREHEPATIGDLRKSLTVLYDCMEKFVREVGALVLQEAQKKA
ncbi:MAG: hypothetical protein ACRDIC_03860 [bacterium]